MENNIVYHYCSLQAFFSIVTSKSFWLTSLSLTNDKEELEYSKSIVSTVVNEIGQDQAYQKYTDQLENLKEVMSMPDIGTKNCYYGMCFVRNKDSLTHWDRYADRCKGVCFGINFNVLDHWLCLESNPNILHHKSVIYQRDEQLKTVKEDLLKNWLPMGDVNDRDYVSYYSAIARRFAPLFKHPDFIDEREYRLVFEEDSMVFQCGPDNIDHVLRGLHLREEQKKFELIGESIRGLYALNLEEFWSSKLIPEVIIGPKCHQNEQELQAFLKAYQLGETSVRLSQVPIR